MMDQLLLGNALIDWLLAIAITAALLTLVAVLKWAAISRLSALAQRTATQLDDSLVDMLRGTRLWLLFFPALLIGSHYLTLAERPAAVFQAIAMLALLVQIGFWAITLLESWVGRSTQRALVSDVAAATSLAVLKFVGKLAIWAVILLMVLDNLGVDITALVAGLGIGGVAVALAVQSILGDLFASLSIVIDKPFVLGDFIVVDEYMGTVEYVGLKTTRIRSLGGEQIVFCNSDLLKTRIRNYKRMRERRVVFTFGVTYQTPPDKLGRIPGMVRAIIVEQKLTRFDRAHFKAFGDSAYEFEVVYWILEPDYNTYMDIQQAINLELVRAFEKAGIGFAYPTRTLFIEPTAAARYSRQHALSA